MDVESKGALSRAEGVEKVVAVEIEPLVFPLRKGVFTAKPSFLHEGGPLTIN